MEGVNIPSYTVKWRGTERRGALEPWRRCQWSTGASQFKDPIMMSQWPNVSQWDVCWKPVGFFECWNLSDQSDYKVLPMDFSMGPGSTVRHVGWFVDDSTALYVSVCVCTDTLSPLPFRLFVSLPLWLILTWFIFVINQSLHVSTSYLSFCNVTKMFLRKSENDAWPVIRFQCLNTYIYLAINTFLQFKIFFCNLLNSNYANRKCSSCKTCHVKY